MFVSDQHISCRLLLINILIFKFTAYNYFCTTGAKYLIYLHMTMFISPCGVVAYSYMNAIIKTFFCEYNIFQLKKKVLYTTDVEFSNYFPVMARFDLKSISALFNFKVRVMHIIALISQQDVLSHSTRSLLNSSPKIHSFYLQKQSKRQAL